MDKTIVISIDSLQSSDIPFLKERPNFSSLLLNSSLVEELEIVYPSYTYPCHASIISGVYPDKHSIIHNEIFPTKKWHWFYKDMKAKSIFYYTRERGLTTSSITWPVTASCPYIDYLIPEIWPEKGKDPDTVFKKANSEKVDGIYEKNKSILTSGLEYYYDIFATNVAIDIISTFSPDLLFIHLSALDTSRHKNGEDIKKNKNALSFLDDAIGKIIKIVKDNGSFSDTTFFLLGDHGQMDIKKVFSINKVLLDMGYITVKDNNVVDYKIIAHPSSFSSFIYTKDINNKEVEKVLVRVKDRYPECIERILNKDEAEKSFHLSGSFSFVIESRDNISFSPSLNSKRIIASPSSTLSSHGYSPQKGPKPPLIVSGKRANVGHSIKKARLVDIAPTILSLYNIQMEDIDGKRIDNLLI